MSSKKETHIHGQTDLYTEYLKTEDTYKDHRAHYLIFQPQLSSLSISDILQWDLE